MNLSEFLPQGIIIVIYLSAGLASGGFTLYALSKGLVRGLSWLPNIATTSGVETKINDALEKQAVKHGQDKAQWQSELKEANKKISELEPLTKKVEQLEGTVEKLNSEVNRLTRDNLELHKTKDDLEVKNGKLKSDNQSLSERTLVAEALRKQSEEFYQGNKMILSQLLQVTQLLAQQYVIVEHETTPKATDEKTKESEKSA